MTEKKDKPGPEPDRLVIKESMEEAIKKALNKPRPKGGWPKDLGEKIPFTCGACNQLQEIEAPPAVPYVDEIYCQNCGAIRGVKFWQEESGIRAEDSTNQT